MAGRQLPSLPQYRKDGVTRRLCASVHLNEAFARLVHHELIADRLTGTGPPLGINLVALARHAQAALGRRDALDRSLRPLFLAFWVGPLAGLWALVAGHGALAMLIVYGPVAVFGAAWWLVRRAEAQAREAAQSVYRAGEKADLLAPPLDPATEARLAEMKRFNVVTYTAAAQLSHPFVGSGKKIKETVWQPIDVSRPADAPGGGKLAIKPFDAVDLHTYVAKEMEAISGLEGLRVRNRLYVVGVNAYMLPELLPDRTGRPRAQVPKQLVQAGLQRPGAGMRTHLCLERVGEGGRVIVSMYLRARLHHPSLTWEVAAYAIPPLHAAHSRVDRLPISASERWWSLVSHATRATWPELRGAGGRIRARRRLRRVRTRDLAKVRRDITEQHLVYDCGAEDSLRELIGDWAQAGYTERVDSQDFLFRLQQGVLVATERFLEAHHVDTGSFDRAQQVISTQTYNISGDITGPANIGGNGQITVQGQQSPQGSGP